MCGKNTAENVKYWPVLVGAPPTLPLLMDRMKRSINVAQNQHFIRCNHPENQQRYLISSQTTDKGYSALNRIP